MQRYELGRQDRGWLAEVLAAGLYKHSPDSLQMFVEWHTRDRYQTQIRTRIRVSRADITRYCWTDELSIPVPDDIFGSGDSV